MTEEQAINEIIKFKQEKDPENRHILLDEVLCRFLKSLGYKSLVSEYNRIPKGYRPRD